MVELEEIHRKRDAFLADSNRRVAPCCHTCAHFRPFRDRATYPVFILSYDEHLGAACSLEVLETGQVGSVIYVLNVCDRWTESKRVGYLFYKDDPQMCKAGGRDR